MQNYQIVLLVFTVLLLLAFIAYEIYFQQNTEYFKKFMVDSSQTFSVVNSCDIKDIVFSAECDQNICRAIFLLFSDPNNFAGQPYDEILRKMTILDNQASLIQQFVPFMVVFKQFYDWDISSYAQTPIQFFIDFMFKNDDPLGQSILEQYQTKKPTIQQMFFQQPNSSDAINVCLDVFDDQLIVQYIKFHMIGQVLLIKKYLNVQQYLYMIQTIITNSNQNLATTNLDFCAQGLQGKQNINCYSDFKNLSDVQKKEQFTIQGKYLVYMYYNIYIKFFSGRFSIVDPIDVHSVYSNFRGNSTDIDDQGYTEQMRTDSSGKTYKVITNFKNVVKPQQSFFDQTLTTDEQNAVFAVVGKQIRPYIESDIFIYFWLYGNLHYNQLIEEYIYEDKMYDSKNSLWLQLERSWWRKWYNFTASLIYIKNKIGWEIDKMRVKIVNFLISIKNDIIAFFQRQAFNIQRLWQIGLKYLEIGFNYCKLEFLQYRCKIQNASYDTYSGNCLFPIKGFWEKLEDFVTSPTFMTILGGGAQLLILLV